MAGCDKLIIRAYAFAPVTGMASGLCIWICCCTCHSCDQLIVCVYVCVCVCVFALVPSCHSGDKLSMCMCSFGLAIGMTSRLFTWNGCCTCYSCDKSITYVCAFALLTGMTSGLCIWMVSVLVTQVTS